MDIIKAELINIKHIWYTEISKTTIQQRQKRAKNVIAYSVPKSNSSKL